VAFGFDRGPSAGYYLALCARDPGKAQKPRRVGAVVYHLGLSIVGPPVISTIEIIGLTALWIPALATSASVTLMITTAGAAGTWLIHGPRSTAAYPGTILVLVASLAWFSRQR
jgi:hypothetical protein